MELRMFTPDDAEILLRLGGIYACLPRSELENMISVWNSGLRDGQRFERLAAIEDGEAVGMVTIAQSADYVASIEPEIFVKFRRRGYGKAVMREAMERARAKGYRIAVASVRGDNVAGLRLFRRLNYLQDHVCEHNGQQYTFFLRLLDC